MREFTAIDWSIIVAYLVLAVVVGAAMSKTASKSLESYFVAERKLPWWWLGTSMAATTFAADTPLVVSGMVAEHGIAGNWFWWAWAISNVSLAVIFASLWRRAKVITDAELVEMRYTGRSATVLRGFKATFFSIMINAIVLGWVIRAMSKIADPFVHWENWLGPGVYGALQAHWPHWLLLGNLSDTFTVILLFALITTYSTMGGIRGVIITDLFQFAIALGASIAFAWVAVEHVGGLTALRHQIALQYHNARQILSFVPKGSGGIWLPIQVFLIYLGVQWWAQYFADGSGYLAQRVSTAKNDAHAEGGSLWFCIANYALRTWPWILIGLVALVIYPVGGDATTAGAKIVAADREMAYPVLMAKLLPNGLLGVLFVSLLAAFMSTVDTQINWGSSYLVNDLYLRFIRPEASERERVIVSRITVVLLASAAVVVAGQISSIEKAWKFFIALGAGLGLPSMLRWIWWRVNAWTEIIGMVVATTCAIVLYSANTGLRDEYIIAIVAAAGTVAAFIATFVTKPVPREHLEKFVDKVGPPGFWRDFAGRASRGKMRWLAYAWFAGNATVFGLTFGIGYLLLGQPISGIIMVVCGTAGVWLTLAATGRARATL